MKVVFRPGRIRRAVAVSCAALLCHLGFIVLGDAGAGLVFLAALGWWRRQAWNAEQRFVGSSELVHYWQTSFAIAYKFRGRRWQWVCVDEVSPETYAELRRFAKVNLVRQPDGLSISR